MAAALPPEGGSFSSLSIDALEDELQIQTIILASALEDPENAEPTATATARKAISDLKKRIAQAKGQTQGGESSSNSTGPSTMNNSRSYYSGRNNTLHPGSHLSVGAFPSTSFGNAQRKRQFPSHFDDDDSSGPRTKSYRTTPSPMQTTTTTPSGGEGFFNDDLDDFAEIIDLTGDGEDDKEQFVNSQRAMWDQFEQANKDKKLAQQLQNALSPPANSQSVSVADSTNGPSAFDRILGRRSQPPVQLPSQSFSQPSQPNTEAGPSSSNVPRYTMPGSFLDDEDEDEYLTEWLITGRPDPNTTLWPESMPSFDFDTAATTNGHTPQRGYTAQDPNGPLSYTGSSGFASSSNRPGMLQSGSYDVLRTSMWQPGSSLANPANLNGVYHGNQTNNSGSLLDICNNVNGIDWLRGTDRFGNRISDRLQGFYDDVRDDPRRTAEEIKDLLANIRPDEEIPEEDRMGTPEALRYALYPHQKTALTWMTGSETGKNKGGILADDMGLGKTISTLALMVSRPSSDRAVKTNLIIGPVSLIKQWETEIRKKVKPEHSLSVLLLHGSGQKRIGYDQLRTYDVVLTTYGKIGQQSKLYDKWVEQHPGANPEREAALAKDCPLVHPRSKFYRVILDEAQCIKNVTTLQAKGTCKVNATYRWCLTGTPMMNGVHELYSLIRFLRIAPYHNQKEFSKMFGTLSARTNRNRNWGQEVRERAMTTLRVLLKAIMLRRMKTSQIDGKPLLTLPPKTEEVVHAVFSEDERAFYDTLESKSRVIYNKYLRAGTVGKNYSNVLVLLLRLRQACCHPHLNLDVDYAGSSEVTEEDMVSLAKTLVPDVVKRIQSAANEGFNCPICLDATVDPTFVLPCGHSTCSECFSTLVAGAAQREIQAGAEGNSGLRCPECRGPVDAKRVINLAAFRAVHMPETVDKTEEDHSIVESGANSDEASSDSQSEDDDDDDTDEVDKSGNLAGFIVDDSDEEESAAVEGNGDGEDDDNAFIRRRLPQTSKKSKKRKSNNKGKAKEKKKQEVKPHELKELRHQAKKNKVDYKRYMKYLKKNWLPSAKVTECCRILQEIKESGDKTIVFSQFTFLLDLLEIPLKHELDIQYCRYDGGMTRQQRDAAAMDFQDIHSSTKVMLVSLKAGNAGLNLTAANHVVLMDPFWNPYIENQAVDRAHRIGQQKPVQVHRLLVKETVEDRIVAIQENKRKFVEAALDEGESKSLGRLSMQDLNYLFNGIR